MEHPYKQFENSQLWKILSAGIEDLVRNEDIVEKTARNYIVGYLCKILDDQKHLK
ncbi:hypothetical protein H1230_19250 [Paenibacillus sp. 19GGS1-52]|uniref:hypothetical protein n=1 Tax=Paenibacillus sp. 19GGS1-52 TaxID=2758563 RepID=UPI001EFBF4AC|nr:hypothetical protein [Paenibacillus sp. 19GGS1-52]ULO05240.1 hypothetical protein H1230_19250 [Paenibacillus sp. 19GGS1-52]